VLDDRVDDVSEFLRLDDGRDEFHAPGLGGLPVTLRDEGPGPG